MVQLYQMEDTDLQHQNPEAITPVTPGIIVKSSSSPKKYIFMMAGVLILVVVFMLFSFISANVAANNYQKRYLSYQKSTKANAQKASTAVFSNLINLTSLETTDQYKAEQQSCTGFQSLAVETGKTVTTSNSLSKNLITNVGAIFSSKYRRAEQLQTSTNSNINIQKTMLTYLQRISQGCKVYVSDVAAEESDAQNSISRNNLLVQSGQNGITCYGGSSTCLLPGNTLAYKALYGTVLQRDRTEIATYANGNCNYPQLDAVCKQNETLWQQYYVVDQQYYAALSPTGAYDAVSHQYAALDTNHWNAAVCTVLQQSQPTLYAKSIDSTTGACNTTLSLSVLLQADEQATHATTQKLL